MPGLLNQLTRDKLPPSYIEACSIPRTSLKSGPSAGFCIVAKVVDSLPDSGIGEE